jgi:hypothetical protein
MKKQEVPLSQRRDPARNRVLRRTRWVACVPALAVSLACAPTVNVLGVYFPGWLISGVVGLVAAYALVWWLGRRPGVRSLAQSGLLFCSLTVSVGLAVWWVFFSGF